MRRLFNFEIRNDLACEVKFVGIERQPVLVIDGLMQRPETLVDFACTQVGFESAATPTGGYPGIIAPAPIEYAKPVGLKVDPFIREFFALGEVRLVTANCRFSLVTRHPDDLTPLQRVPHIDTVNPLQFALLHYLCGPEFGGTGFYRHRTTGFETITAERAESYDSARDAALDQTPPPNAYFSGNSTEFDEIGTVSSQFNRLIIYRSCLLHSGIINSVQALSPDPRAGRLTANIFITYR